MKRANSRSSQLRACVILMISLISHFRKCSAAPLSHLQNARANSHKYQLSEDLGNTVF